MDIEVIGLAAMAAFISELSGIVDQLKHMLWQRGYHTADGLPLRLKPLDCPLCLGYWLGLLYYGVVWHGFIALLLCPFIVAVLSFFIIKLAKS